MTMLAIGIPELFVIAFNLVLICGIVGRLRYLLTELRRTA